MKSLLILFLFFFSFGLTQTLNELVIKKINNYRKEYGLPSLVYAPEAKLANDQMLNYMTQTCTVPLDHSQRIPTSFPVTFETFQERYEYLYKNTSCIALGENICSFVDLKTDEERANKIIDLWKNSQSHNALLLTLRFTGICVSNKTTNKIIVDGITFNDKIRYCVLTVYK